VTLPESIDISGPLPKLTERKYDPGKDRERVRGALAIGLLITLGMVVVAAFVAIWTGWMSEPDVKDLLTVIFGPIVALTGSALGFYFGGKVDA
jgi:hypothetical protein